MQSRIGAVTAMLLVFPVLAFMQSRNTLDIYSIDVEGGQSTLFVSPSGDSLLIDAGSAGERDAGRIVETAKGAGLTQIDYLLVTHYDGDHVGGVKDVSDRMTVKNFVDYGPRARVPTAPEPTQQQIDTITRANEPYAAVTAKGNHVIVKAGDVLPVKGIDVRIVSAKGTVIKKPLADGGKPNPLCAAYMPHPTDTTENYNSLGAIVGAFGRFRMLDLGDLTWNIEHELVCPNNLLGTVDVYLTTHHGLARSGLPALVGAIAPRVAVMNNGARKGGSVETWDTLRKTKSIQDVWQLHYSEERPPSVNFEEQANPGGPAYNVDEQFIANLDRTPPPAAQPPAATVEASRGRGRGPQLPPHSPAYLLKVSVQPDGSFTVTNSRNGFSRQYAAGPKR